MNKDAKILIVGQNDIIENSIFNYLHTHSFSSLLSSTSSNLDIFNQSEVKAFFEKEKPEYVFLTSSRSGGIGANIEYAAEFIYSNLQSQNNIIHAAYESGVKKLLFFTGSCVYPKACPQPMKEEYLLTGPLEKTSEPYSVAKIAGVKLCETYRRQYGFNAIAAVPATVYGPGSDFEMETAHVIGALIGKFYDAMAHNQDEVAVWGTGKPRREFIYSDDFVEASIFLMENYGNEEMINMGCGQDISIEELAQIIKEVSGFQGNVIFDSSKPDGTMQKLMDSSKINQLGWKSKVSLQQGIEKTYKWYDHIHKMEVGK